MKVKTKEAQRDKLIDLVMVDAVSVDNAIKVSEKTRIG